MHLLYFFEASTNSIDSLSKNDGPMPKYRNEIDISGSIFEELTKKLVKKDRLYKVQENLRPLYGSKILEKVVEKDPQRGPIINQFLKGLVGTPVIGQKF